MRKEKHVEKTLRYECARGTEGCGVDTALLNRGEQCRSCADG